MNRPSVDEDPAEVLLRFTRELDRLRNALTAVRRQAVNGLGEADRPVTAQWLNLIRDTADAALRPG